MTLFILTETSAGYALLKAKDKKLLKRDDLAAQTDSPEGINSLLKLKNFQKFDSAATALEEVAAVVDGKVTPRLSELLNSIKDEKKVSLAVADPKLGNAIGKLPGLEIKAIADSTTLDLYRAIRNNLPSLIPGLVPDDINTMSLGLSHSLARHKLKFSPDKIDTMIVQAIGLLDDLDKELNTYAMRVKEWYGWHFPEMAKILNDNLAYSRVVLKMGMRSNFEKTDLAEILPEEIETAVKSAADRSMGTEITQEDLENIQALAQQVVDFTEYRQQLASYLSARMTAIAPNLTALVGELVGARLIAHAGSLMNLSKSPASTIQILGAEKALFRALKTKHDTPKYGLIYHASLIGQASGKNKGKMARVLAAKAAIGLRVDALQDWGEDEADIGEEEKAALGIESRYRLERKLAAMEGKPLKPRGVAIAPNGVTAPQPKKWEIKEARKYNPDADGLAGDEAPQREENADSEDKPRKKKDKKEKKRKLVEEIPDPTAEPESKQAPEDAEMEDSVEDHAPEQNGVVNQPTLERTISPAKVPSLKIQTNGSTFDNMDDSKSDTIATPSSDSPDSPDSPTQQERNWQSSIPGNTKEAKRLRKIERHERKLAMSETRSAQKKARREKLQRKLERKERREMKAQQLKRREERDNEKYTELAAKAGLSVERYKRKLERGEIRFEADGTPVAVSKKDIKKAKKMAEAESATQGEEAGKKRKRSAEVADDGERSTEKKKKKKSKILDPQSAVLTNAEVLASLQKHQSRKRPQLRTIGEYRPPDLTGYKNVVKDVSPFFSLVVRNTGRKASIPFYPPSPPHPSSSALPVKPHPQRPHTLLDSTTPNISPPPPKQLNAYFHNLSPHLLHIPPPSLWLHNLLVRLRPYDLTQAETLMIINLGLGFERPSLTPDAQTNGGGVVVVEGEEGEGGGGVEDEAQGDEQLLQSVVEEMDQRYQPEDVEGILKVVRGVIEEARAAGGGEEAPPRAGDQADKSAET
ncbi:MAG: hypothetical protein Q9227_004513 [Pyrenula ochraceoflavens]